MQTGRIYTDNRILGLYGIARENGRKKEDCEKTDKDRTRTRIVQIAEGLSGYTRLCTSHLTPHSSGGQSTPPHHPPPSRHASTLLAPRPTLQGPQRSTRTRPLLGPWTAGGPFSVQQPCESHVVHTPAVIPRPPCLSTRCHLTQWPTPRSAVGLMPPS
jgi:hypothetical protein